MFFVPQSEENNNNAAQPVPMMADMSIMPKREILPPALIKVVGVGGGGGNAVAYMCRIAEQENLRSVEFYDVNTDRQVLDGRTASNCTTVQIGLETTSGQGAGADPVVGRKSAEENRDALENMLDKANMLFLSVGMGGGTGTGAAPLIAEVAREKNILTVAVVTKPFAFEGGRRMRQAMEGIEQLRKYVDSIIIIPNDKLRFPNEKVTFQESFNRANAVLSQCVMGIAKMITSSGGDFGNDINVDFADVRSVMSNKGLAMIGMGYAEGEGRAEKAMKQALSSPLLENTNIQGATGLLISISVGPDMLTDEVYSMMEMINGYAEDALNVFGCTQSEAMTGKIGVTVVATGIGHQELPKAQPQQPTIPQPRPEEQTVNIQTHQYVSPPTGYSYQSAQGQQQQTTGYQNNYGNPPTTGYQSNLYQPGAQSQNHQPQGHQQDGQSSGLWMPEMSKS